MSHLSSGLKWDDQLVTITLPDPLHSGASVITTEHPHMRINIPVLLPEETECTTLPLGKAHTIPAATSPKTPWKPRISLATEVNDLLTWAMVDNSNHELEHSATEGGYCRSSYVPIPQVRGSTPTSQHFFPSKYEGGRGFPQE